jgi:pyridoxal phosphate enzyme (YggS family)
MGTTVAASLEARYREVMARIAGACAKAGRSPGTVMTVAVSKYADFDDVRALAALGHRDFGESRVQQLVQRAAMMDELAGRQKTMTTVAARRAGGLDSAPPDAVRWHLIGHLQRNKVTKAIPTVRLIQSVDSLRLIEEIQTFAVRKDYDVDVLVQVNCSGEASKYGCAVPAAQHLCEQIDLSGNIRIRGLMTMAPHVENPEDARPTFERCRDLFDDIARRGIGGEKLNILSMGMTNDFEVAIDCGSNLVRIGSAIFGTKADHIEDEDTD